MGVVARSHGRLAFAHWPWHPESRKGKDRTTADYADSADKKREEIHMGLQDEQDKSLREDELLMDANKCE